MATAFTREVCFQARGGGGALCIAVRCPGLGSCSFFCTSASCAQHHIFQLVQASWLLTFVFPVMPAWMPISDHSYQIVQPCAETFLTSSLSPSPLEPGRQCGRSRAAPGVANLHVTCRTRAHTHSNLKQNRPMRLCNRLLHLSLLAEQQVCMGLFGKTHLFEDTHAAGAEAQHVGTASASFSTARHASGRRVPQPYDLRC